MKTAKIGHYGPEVPVESVETAENASKPSLLHRAVSFLNSLRLQSLRDVVLVTLYSAFFASLAWVLTLRWAVEKMILGG